MSGVLVGTSKPNASIILDQCARTWQVTVLLNKAFAEESEDKKYTYNILIPRKVGCNFQLFNSMSNNGTNFSHYAVYSDIVLETIYSAGCEASWAALVDNKQINAHLRLDNVLEANTEEIIGCFTKYTLDVYIRDHLELCNLTFCIGGTLYLKCGQTTEGCEKFPVYINYISETSATVEFGDLQPGVNDPVDNYLDPDNRHGTSPVNS